MLTNQFVTRKQAVCRGAARCAPTWLLFLLLILGLLTACDPAEPTTAPTPLAPAAVPIIVTATSTITPVPLPSNPLPSEATAVASSGTLLPPTPAGSGLRPSQARLNFVPDAGPDETGEEWRPPPLPAPLSLHPDDHYWLIRPLPSGSRNYDLEWYPFGNWVNVSNRDPLRIHHGLDFPNETGTPILAASSGTVVHAGPLPSPRNGVNYYGNTVIIQHDWQWRGQDVFTLYAHTLELFVKVGEYVAQGEVIAGVGNSGEVSGPHLHFEVRVGRNNYWFAQNPALWIVPFEGYGTLAGQLVDRRGRPISEARLQLTPVETSYPSPIRIQYTYHPSVQSSATWQENFVIADLPAGEYTLTIDVNDIRYRRNVTILPGQTRFEYIATQFLFVPTATPTPDPATEVITDTVGTEVEEGTVTPTPAE